MILGVSGVFIFPSFSSVSQPFPQRVDTEQIVQENPEIQPERIIPDSSQRERESNQSNPFKIIQGTPRRGVKSIEDLLRGSFSTFYFLLKLTQDNLTDLLNQNHLVIFAPTEAVWGSLSEQLRQDKNEEQLIQLLRNHIVVGGISDAQFQQGSVQTLGGETLQIQRTDNEIEVNGIKVSSSNFIQSIEQNSVIIPVDQLLFEPGLR